LRMLDGGEILSTGLSIIFPLLFTHRRGHEDDLEMSMGPSRADNVRDDRPQLRSRDLASTIEKVTILLIGLVLLGMFISGWG